MEIHLITTECHLPYGITQCYLPPDTSDTYYTRPSSCPIATCDNGVDFIISRPTYSIRTFVWWLSPCYGGA